MKEGILKLVAGTGLDQKKIGEFCNRLAEWRWVAMSMWCTCLGCLVDVHRCDGNGLYLLIAWFIDESFPQFQVDLLAHESQERRDPTAPTSDTMTKTEAKRAAIEKNGEQSRAGQGRAGQSRAGHRIEWQADHHIHHGNGPRTGTRGQKWSKRAIISSLVIMTGPPLPFLSTAAPTFGRLSATWLLPVASLSTFTPVPASSQFGLELCPGEGSCSP